MSTGSSLVGLASADLAEILVMFVFECFGLFDIWLLSLRWYRLFVHPVLSRGCIASFRGVDIKNSLIPDCQ